MKNQIYKARIKKIILNSFLLLAGYQLFSIPSYAQDNLFQEKLAKDVEFLVSECSINIYNKKDTYRTTCDRLRVSKGETSINFHFDYSNIGGISFIVKPKDQPIIINNYLNLSKYQVIGNFRWSNQTGVIEDSVRLGTGNCQVYNTKVLCSFFKADEKLEIQAMVKF